MILPAAFCTAWAPCTWYRWRPDGHEPVTARRGNIPCPPRLSHSDCRASILWHLTEFKLPTDWLKFIHWPAEQGARCKVRTVGLVLVSPQELAGHRVHGTTSLWSLSEFQGLEGVHDAWRGTGSSMPARHPATVRCPYHRHRCFKGLDDHERFASAALAALPCVCLDTHGLLQDPVSLKDWRLWYFDGILLCPPTSFLFLSLAGLAPGVLPVTCGWNDC